MSSKRQTRHIPFQDCDLRARREESLDGKEIRIGGYVSKFNKASENLGWFREVREYIAPGAFANTIKNDDIRAFWNHNSDLIIGRNKAGTLELSEDEVGLRYEVKLPDTEFGRSYFVAIERGDVTGTSFMFDVVAENVDYGTDQDDPIVRTLNEVKLYEVSPVIFPAYPDSEAEARDEGSFRAWAKRTLDEVTLRDKDVSARRIRSLEAEVQAQAQRVRVL